MAARQVLCHSDDANLWSLRRGPDPKHTALNIRRPIWEFFIAPNIVSSSLAGWLCLRIRGCGWLVILILFMACDICHRPIPMLCVWFEPSSMIANGIQDSAIPPNGCSRLKTRKSFIFVRSWAGQHHPSQIQVHRGENIGEQRNIATSTSGQPKRAVGPLTQGAVGVGG